MSLNFKTSDELIKYLQTNANGKDILREAVYGLGGEWIEGELADRIRPTRFLVKIHRCGYAEALGPPRSRAKILFLGRKDTFPGEEIARENAVLSSLPHPYKILTTCATAHKSLPSCRYCGSEEHGGQCPNYRQ